MKSHLVNKSYIGVALSVLLALASCKKLDEKVYSSAVSSNYYTNSDQVMSAYVLPYSFLQGIVYGVHFPVDEFTTDEAVNPVKDGQFGQYSGNWIRFHQHTWTSQEQFIQYEWSNLFQGVGYCNDFIDELSSRQLTFSLPVPKAQLIAEVKMMRALYYYWALNEFGNVPIATHVGQSTKTNTRAEVFAFIEGEIKANIPLLGEKGDVNWYGHFTRSAANALLAKLYLNAQVFTGTPRWSDCIAACDAVITSGKYSLDSTWNTPFLMNNEFSNENIFVVPYDANFAPGFNAGLQQLPSVMKQKYNLTNFPYNAIVTQQSFYNLYDTTDFRIKQWLVGPQTYDSSGITLPLMGAYDQSGHQLIITPVIDSLNNQNSGYGQGVNNIKYEIRMGTSGAPLPDNMSNDLVIFRLADILMTKAEATMRTNGGTANTNAVALVNQVRARSFTAGNPLAVYNPATLTLDELLNERGREFSYEMKRREDLIRFGKFENAWWAKPADPDKHRELFPIPLNILNSNPAIKQNPGY